MLLGIIPEENCCCLFVKSFGRKGAFDDIGTFIPLCTFETCGRLEDKFGLKLRNSSAVKTLGWLLKLLVGIVENLDGVELFAL